jgi:N4-gp56 family major capsid protein
VNTWVSWAGGAAYAAPALSVEVYKQALAEMVFDQLCDVAEDYGAGMGSEYYYRITGGLTPGPTDLASNTLNENVAIPLDTWTHIRADVHVLEIGRGASFSKRLEVLSKWRIDTQTRELLKDHLVAVEDQAAAAQFLLTDAVYSPTGVASGQFALNGVAPAQALSNLNVYHLNRVHDYMRTTLRVPYYANGEYVCVASTHALRGLKDDSEYERWQLYAEPQKRQNGEVGRCAGFRFIETNNLVSLPSMGLASVCGGAVFIGKQGVKKIVAAAPIILAENTGDFGRNMRIAWWGLEGWGISWMYTLHAGARIVRLAST